MIKPLPKPGILNIKPYVGGLHELNGPQQVIVLASNEAPFGPSPLAVQAYEMASKRLHLYPDGSSTELRLAISERFGLDPDLIVCGAGSDEIISLLVSAYAGVGDEVLHTEHGFLMYPINARSVGATPIAAQETHLRADIEKLINCLTERTKMVFLANPNNPTGSYIKIDELKKLHSALPSDVMLVIDAAYAEYVSQNDYIDGAELVEKNQNIVMTRTYSKAFGLAALRLGWAYCPPHVADVLNRVRNPFNVTAPSQAAGIAAVGDLEHTDATIAHNNKLRPKFSSYIESLGLEVVPSVGNFVLVRFGRAEHAQSAYDHLLNKGIITRMMSGYGLPDSLRITIGLEPELMAVVDALSQHQKLL